RPADRDDPAALFTVADLAGTHAGGALSCRRTCGYLYTDRARPATARTRRGSGGARLERPGTQQAPPAHVHDAAGDDVVRAAGLVERDEVGVGTDRDAPLGGESQQAGRLARERRQRALERHAAGD